MFFTSSCLFFASSSRLSLLSTGKRNINQQAINGNTLLLLACYNKHWDIVRYLLTFERIDVNLADKNGCNRFTPAYHQ
ncbi:ankyrin repeat domain-containing protein [Legionella tunisiensis]|uniref:ankyrin repeat domain-containing protein n=1 Tax=Legionella tunisiensis TaxID=1034944 RepID=UPI0038BC844F